MAQLWTIVSTVDGTVLHAAFFTDSAGQHPKDKGWPWDATKQKATRIDARPNTALQRFDGIGWVTDVAACRAERWAAIKAARDRAEWGGCLTPLGRVDTDPDSQRKVSGSVQMAMIALAAGAPLEIPWTMQNNETVQHDASAMIQMGVAVGQHVAACHGEALMRRMALEAAEDAAAINAVPIAGGWPGAIA